MVIKVFITSFIFTYTSSRANNYCKFSFFGCIFTSFVLKYLGFDMSVIQDVLVGMLIFLYNYQQFYF
jgi:hypothetical protein